jgi:acetamidase/formamidase
VTLSRFRRYRRLASDQIQPELRRLSAEVPKEARGPGGHPLTGPIAIDGAQPGDVLEVRIREIRLDVPNPHFSHWIGESRKVGLRVASRSDFAI